MRIGPTLITALAFVLATADANASPLTYVIGNNDVEGTHHFGTVDLATGAFQQIGPNAPVGSEGVGCGIEWIAADACVQQRSVLD